MFFDTYIINFAGNLRGSVLNVFMSAITHLADSISIIILIIFTGLILAKFKKYYYLAVLLLASGGGELLSKILKITIRRARPEILPHIAYADGFSFPSGHTFAATVFFGFLAYILAKKFQNKNAKLSVWLFFSLLILTIGFSRVYLGVHWPTDVLGSFVIGSFWLIGIILFFKKYFSGLWITNVLKYSGNSKK
jgi:undecaprenyl-diphosphatase